MKKLSFAVMLCFFTVFLFQSCAQTTDLLYGPEATPEQVRQYIYEDAFALGAMRAEMPDFDYDEVMRRVEVFKAASDPSAILQEQMLKLMEEGKAEYALIYFAASRLIRRVGATYINDVLDVSGVDRDLLNYAADAYVAGINKAVGK